MSLQAFLNTLSLSSYQPLFTAKGYTDLDQFLSLSDPELDQVIQNLGLLKGHSFKFKKGIESARKGDNNNSAPVKKPKLDDTKKPKIEEPKKTPVKNKVSLVKDVEKLVARLEEIEQLKAEVLKATDVILGIDLERFRRGLEQVELVRNSLREVGIMGNYGTNRVSTSTAEIIRKTVCLEGQIQVNEDIQRVQLPNVRVT